MTVTADARPDASAASATSRAGRPLLTLLFAVTSFTGAGLLFMVQPMVAKMLLPHFGGSASVWSTSNLFFQTLLLGGYLYVHVATRHVKRTIQPLTHVVLLLAPFLVLPVALPAVGSTESSPVLRLLMALAVMIGLPFLVMTTTGPLLQRWYSWTGLARSEDPYFLFATSNLGSFGGLLAYPFLVEPFLQLDQQRTWWTWGFVAFVLLMSSCAVQAWRGARTSAPAQPVPTVEAPSASVTTPPAPGWRTIALWLFLAFLPSTLMLSVTSHISTDIAAIPLMWVVPLAIYLATFVIAFAVVDRDPGRRVLQVALAVAAVGAIVSVSVSTTPLLVKLVLDLVLLSAGAYAAHARLAATRPHPEHLTRFYLVVAAGGAVGGLLNGVIAPAFFDRVWEYPLALAGVVLLGLGTVRRDRGRYHPAFVLVAQAVAVGMALFAGTLVLLWASTKGGALMAVGIVVCLVLGFAVSRRPAALALGVIGVLIAAEAVGGSALYRDRTFYGSYEVQDVDDSRVFVHGTTVHGVQLLDDPLEPVSYYGRGGPVGELFAARKGLDSVGVVGLGVGTFASYVGAGQDLTFFEIDPEVVRVAEDPELFTFLSSTEADVRQVVGDGRLSLAKEAEDSFDLVVLDAFTSDAIPVHLLTREAFRVYDRAVADDGVLLVHISNRMFDLEPVIAQAADDLGWSVLVGQGEGGGDALASMWVALAPTQAGLGTLADHPDWRAPKDDRVTWTDDFSSVLSVLDVQ